VAYDVFWPQPSDGGCGLFSDEARTEPYGEISAGRIRPLKVVSCGVWGALLPVLSAKVAVGGALMTGALLFLPVVTLGFLVSREGSDFDGLQGSLMSAVQGQRI
jgi:hypothetical protein